MFHKVVFLNSGVGQIYDNRQVEKIQVNSILDTITVENQGVFLFDITY